MSEPRRDDDQPPVPPTQPAEDGDTLTAEDEAALDAAAAQIPDDVLQASIEWTRKWAKTPSEGEQ